MLCSHIAEEQESISFNLEPFYKGANAKQSTYD
jgi:hypothetical protein